MINIDFKAEALAFTIKHSCPPACIIEKAMKRGAELAIIKATQKVNEATEELAAQRRANLPQHVVKTISLDGTNQA